MKTYTGNKLINAQPMTRAEYNDYRNWALPENENGADEGYLVEYTDGGAPNDSRHAGYISWSPKAQFDAAYIELPEGTDQLQPWQQRVVAEHAEMYDRCEKLDSFIGADGSTFDGLSKVDRLLLISQMNYMALYTVVLEERIDRFLSIQ